MQNQNNQENYRDYIFLETDPEQVITLMYPLSFTEVQIQDYIKIIDQEIEKFQIQKIPFKVYIDMPEISVTLCLYLLDKKINLYVPENIYEQIEKFLPTKSDNAKINKVSNY